jgi:hypothetical protein
VRLGCGQGHFHNAEQLTAQTQRTQSRKRLTTEDTEVARSPQRNPANDLVFASRPRYSIAARRGDGFDHRVRLR